MESWLLNPCLVPKLVNSIPISFTPSRKRKQSLEVPYRKLNLCGTGKNSTASQVASMAGGMIYSAFLFRFFFRVLFCICSESKVFLTVGIRANYLCLGVLYVVATVGFSLCVWHCLFGVEPALGLLNLLEIKKINDRREFLIVELKRGLK